jgi:ABC-type multidrug transport system permease subunit
MLRPAAIAFSFASLITLATAAAVFADTNPSPPPGWFLLLLIALLLILFGFAIGRRRPARASA